MPLLRLKSDGRGAHYSVGHGFVESALRLAYARDWPAKLWANVPGSCDVETAKLTLPMLPPGARRLRLGFISDLHIGPTTPAALLDNAFQRLGECELDVLLLGGDYVLLDVTEQKAARLASLVARVPARHKFAVLGNHDIWTRQTVLEDALLGVGVDVLCNEHRRLEYEGSHVAVVGFDEPWTGRLDAPAAFREVAAPDAIVVLCHSPEGVLAAGEQVKAIPGIPPALYVCGHTHGGHLAAPWGPVRMIIPGVLGKRFPRGLHPVGPVQLYVSRGVGGAELPMRTFARPEIVIFDLLPRAS